MFGLLYTQFLWMAWNPIFVQFLIILDFRPVARNGKLRTRSTTTRDRNLQFRDAVSIVFFFEFSLVDFPILRRNESIYHHRSGPLLENGLDRPETRYGRYGFASFLQHFHIYRRVAWSQSFPLKIFFSLCLGGGGRYFSVPCILRFSL